LAFKPGDMFIADGQGVVSSITYSLERRTQVTPDTRNVVFTVYAPPGVGSEAVEAHRRNLESNGRLIAP
jgi:DNA/RNA-binding domain of Phe-tRNA-synthetase-like protein